MSNQATDKNKVLIISYYWPPAGGPGVQRWLKFTKYLPEFGITPHVYLPKNPSYPILDNEMAAENLSGVVIVKRKIFEPYQIASFFLGKKIQKISSGIISKSANQSIFEKIFMRIRGNFFIPDARIFWIRPSVKFLSKYIKDHNITTIITTGPPHSLHVIGMKLRQKMEIRWIADFRDPWTTIGYQKSLQLSEFAEQKHKVLERKVLQTADQIIVTSPTSKAEFSEITGKPIEVITNGYDEIENVMPPQMDKFFSISHIGSLLSDRNPLFLWEIFQELKLELHSFSSDFKLKLIGSVSEEVLETIDLYGLKPNLLNIGYLSHKESISEQRKSQVLLLIEIDSIDTKCIIPGKLFEYLVSKRPIIAIGPEGSDIKSIVEKSETGIFVNYSEKAILKTHIIDLYNKFQTNSIAVNAQNIGQYSRLNLTKKLVQIILQ